MTPVFIRDFSLLRFFESIILELPYVAGTGQKTFTTINGGSVTISNPFVCRQHTLVKVSAF